MIDQNETEMVAGLIVDFLNDQAQKDLAYIVDKNYVIFSNNDNKVYNRFTNWVIVVTPGARCEIWQARVSFKINLSDPDSLEQIWDRIKPKSQK